MLVSDGTFEKGGPLASVTSWSPGSNAPLFSLLFTHRNCDSVVVVGRVVVAVDVEVVPVIVVVVVVVIVVAVVAVGVGHLKTLSDQVQS